MGPSALQGTERANSPLYRFKERSFKGRFRRRIDPTPPLKSAGPAPKKMDLAVSGGTGTAPLYFSSNCGGQYDEHTLISSPASPAHAEV
jgi:hypothetical protein